MTGKVVKMILVAKNGKQALRYMRRQETFMAADEFANAVQHSLRLADDTEMDCLVSTESITMSYEELRGLIKTFPTNIAALFDRRTLAQINKIAAATYTVTIVSSGDELQFYFQPNKIRTYRY